MGQEEEEEEEEKAQTGAYNWNQVGTDRAGVVGETDSGRRREELKLRCLETRASLGLDPETKAAAVQIFFVHMPDKAACVHIFIL